MALDGTKWTVDRDTGDIRYIGDDHGGASPAYGTVIEFHRWLQALADDAVASGDDELDITNTDPSRRSTDNIITLINNYNIDKRSSEFLYDGSIIQNDGDDIFDGIVNFGVATVSIQLLQDGKVIADDFWNTGSSGFNADANAGISHRFMIQVRKNGCDIDNRKIIGVSRTWDYSFHEFKINGSVRGNNVLALSPTDDLNNETAIGTVAGWTTISNQEGLRLIDVDNNGTDEEYYSEWNRDSYTINQLYERAKWLSKEPTIEDSCSDSGSDFIIDNATITGAAQSFTNGSNALKITKVVANLKIGTGSPTGDIVCKIYTHSGTYGTSSVPNALNGVQSQPYDAALLTSSYEPVTFEFRTPVNISASTYYCVVFEHADGAAGAYVHIEGLASSGTHSGNRSHNTAGWTAVAADDLAFEVYACPVLNGLAGIEFRGINYSYGYDGETGGISVSTNDMLVWGTLVPYTSGSGTPVIGEAVHENTATPVWKGTIIAFDGGGATGSLLIRIESGTLGNSESFTCQESGFTGTTSADPTEVTGGGTHHIMANDSTDDILYAQILNGAAPTDNVRMYYGGTNLASADFTDYLDVANEVATITERTISQTNPFIGQSTGSALIGSYGLGVEKNDLSSSDLLFDLTNTSRQPPNLVTNTVAGLEVGDRVLVAPWDGVTEDPNGDPAIDKDQLSLDTALTTDNITQVEVTESIPDDTPESGYIRVTDNNGFERRLHYNNWENGTPNRFYNIDTSDGNEDFASVNASVGNDVWIAYIDAEAVDADETFTSVKNAGSRDLVVLVRDGGGSPKKQFISEWTLTTSPQTITQVKISDA